MANPRVLYSIAARLGASGIGHIAHQAALGIHRAEWLERLFVSSNAQSIIPGALIRQWGLLGRAVRYLAAHDATGLLYHAEGMLFDDWVAMGMPIGDLFHGWNGSCLRSLRLARRRGMVTVVERASSHPITQTRLLGEEYRRWGVPLALPKWNLSRLMAEFTEADYITIPSDFVRDSMIAEGVPENKLIELPFGLDPTRFASAAPAPATDHPLRLIFAGQVSVRKGVPYLLEAWRALGWRDAELWLIGGVTPDVATIRSRWPDLEGVRFLGHSTTLGELMAQCDLFVFPSIEEGSALVTYEAMACGLPVVTTPNAGSVARDGIEGYIIPIRDVDALCDRLQHLRANPAVRAEMARSARLRAAEFTWDAYRRKLLAAYERILGSKAA